jgi:VIT family
VFVYDLVAPGEVENAFAWRAAMTGVALFVVGALKSRFIDQHWWRSALETLAVGGLAANAGIRCRRAASGSGVALRHWTATVTAGPGQRTPTAECVDR